MGDIDPTSLYMVDQAVLFIDAAAELAFEIAKEGFGSADALKTAVPLDVPDQLVDPLERLFILKLLVEIVLPGFIGPDLFTHRRP